MEKKLLAPEEIQEIKDLRSERFKLVEQFGEIEINIQDLEFLKQELIKQLKFLKEKEINIGKKMQDKYGDGTIDINSGEFISSI